MNAKKIMGAVLVALLAAALFVGAGSAIQSGTVFVNQALPGTSSGYEVAWVGSNGVFTPLSDGAGNVYFPAGSEGVYTYETSTDKYTLTVKSPEVFVSGIAGSGDYAYQFIDGTYYIGTTISSGKLVVSNPAIEMAGTPYVIYLTYPNGEELEKSAADIITLLNKNGNDAPAVGTYSIRAVFKDNEFIDGTLYTDRITKAVTFKVAEAGEGTIAAAVDQAIKGGNVKVTITGQPGLDYLIDFEAGHFKVAGKQIGFPGLTADTTTPITFKMPNTGSVEFIMTSVADKVENSEKIQLVAKDDEGKFTDTQGSVTIKFEKGTITGATDAKSYFVGDEIKVSGTTTAGVIKFTEISGTNFYVNLTGDAAVGAVKYGTDTVKTFEFELKTADITDKNKKLDVGTYTLTLTTESGVKASIPVVLKQPFISIISAPEVVVKGDEADFIINAEAANEIQWYIFGTNFFNASLSPVNTKVEDTTNQFEFTLSETFTDDMDAGQYFMVIQHPMYDKKFNINATGTTINLIDGNKVTPLFNVDIRQTANAAQALCDALDTQNIDDMYVKYSFFVIGEDESFVINEIPEAVAQGSTFTVSGTATSAAGDYVTVEMISTAFAAVPKETVGSAAFIVLTTQVADDGTWEVTFDTSDLNVDEYSLKVASGTETWKTVNVNVVEAADKPDTPVTPDVPDTPDTPDTPTEPETPGFGALAALAGLGAVAVLLLRRE